MTTGPRRRNPTHADDADSDCDTNDRNARARTSRRPPPRTLPHRPTPDGWCGSAMYERRCIAHDDMRANAPRAPPRPLRVRNASNPHPSAARSPAFSRRLSARARARFPRRRRVCDAADPRGRLPPASPERPVAPAPVLRPLMTRPPPPRPAPPHPVASPPPETPRRLGAGSRRPSMHFSRGGVSTLSATCAAGGPGT